MEALPSAAVVEQDVKSTLLKELLLGIPNVNQETDDFLGSLSLDAANSMAHLILASLHTRANDMLGDSKADLFMNEEHFPNLTDIKQVIKISHCCDDVLLIDFFFSENKESRAAASRPPQRNQS